MFKRISVSFGNLLLCSGWNWQPFVQSHKYTYALTFNEKWNHVFFFFIIELFANSVVLLTNLGNKTIELVLDI